MRPLTWDDADLAAVGPSAWDAFAELIRQRELMPPEPPPVEEGDFDFEPYDTPCEDEWLEYRVPGEGWEMGQLGDIVSRLWDAYPCERRVPPTGERDVEAGTDHPAEVEVRRPSGSRQGSEKICFAILHSSGTVEGWGARWLRSPRGRFHRA